MLSLERRVLEPLLPPIAGLEVVDLGCGSGRWLETLKGFGAHGLTGVDFSPEMLSLARPKLQGAARIVLADCENVPLEPASTDLILCNFVQLYQDAKASCNVRVDSWATGLSLPDGYSSRDSNGAIGVGAFVFKINCKRSEPASNDCGTGSV
jgi:SAM-dependent methyltransferase